MDILYQGEEKPVVLTVSNEDGTTVDLTAFSRIVIYLIINRRTPIKYAYPLEAGYEVLNMAEAATGQIQFNITSDDSLEFPAEAVGKFELTLETAAGEKTKQIGDIFRVKEALSRNE